MNDTTEREWSARLNRTGAACENCGTSYLDCTASVLDEYTACCGRCRSTDTHAERRAVTRPAAEQAPSGISPGLAAALVALQARVDAARRDRELSREDWTYHRQRHAENSVRVAAYRTAYERACERYTEACACLAAVEACR